MRCLFAQGRCRVFCRVCGCVYPECRIGSKFQETADRRGAEVRGRDVQGGAKVKITAGGIHLWNTTWHTNVTPCFWLWKPFCLRDCCTVTPAHLLAGSPAAQRGWEVERRSTLRSAERSCWSSGCAGMARLPEIRASGQSLPHSLHHLHTQSTDIPEPFKRGGGSWQ